MHASQIELPLRAFPSSLKDSSPIAWITFLLHCTQTASMEHYLPMLSVSRSKSAFTLLEIILAISLFVIMLLLGWPAVSAFSNDRHLQTSFLSVADPIEQALDTARTQHIDHWIHLHKGSLFISTSPWNDDPPTANSGGGRLRILDRDDDPRPVRLWRSGHAEPFRIEYRGPHGRWVAGMNTLDRQLRILEWEVAP